MRSWRRSASSIPSAQSTDERRGTTIVESSSSSAIAPAWTAPGAAGDDERQLARVVARAGSRRSSCRAAMLRSITSTIAAAASTAPRPSGPAMRRSIASRAALERELHPAAEEVVGVEVAEHEVGVGARRLRRRRVRRPPGRGSAPALRGPMCSRPPSSSQPIEPPPAPIVCTSIIGSAIAWRLISPSRVTCTSPSLTTEASKLVPPMSTTMQSSEPRPRA